MKKPYIAILSALESIRREARMWKSLWAFLGACGGGELERWEARSSWMKERVPVCVVSCRVRMKVKVNGEGRGRQEQAAVSSRGCARGSQIWKEAGRG